MSKRAFELLIGIISRSGKERTSLFEHEGYFQVESFNFNDSLTLYEFEIGRFVYDDMLNIKYKIGIHFIN